MKAGMNDGRYGRPADDDPGTELRDLNQRQSLEQVAITTKLEINDLQTDLARSKAIKEKAQDIKELANINHEIAVDGHNKISKSSLTRHGDEEL